MFDYWKGRYHELSKQATAVIEGLMERTDELGREVRRLDRLLRECREHHRPIVADTLSLELCFAQRGAYRVTIKTNNTMAVTLPVGKYVIATIKGTEAASGKEGPITEIALVSSEPATLLVEAVADTTNQFKVTTLREGSATLAFSAKNSAGSSLSATEDWLVDNGQVPVIADTLTISYGEPQDVPTT